MIGGLEVEEVGTCCPSFDSSEQPDKARNKVPTAKIKRAMCSQPFYSSHVSYYRQILHLFEQNDGLFMNIIGPTVIFTIFSFTILIYCR